MISRGRNFAVQYSCLVAFFFAAAVLASSPQLSLDLGIEGHWFEEDYHKARTGGGQVTAHFNHQVLSTLEIGVQAKAYLEESGGEAYNGTTMYRFGKKQSAKDDE